MNATKLFKEQKKLALDLFADHNYFSEFLYVLPFISVLYLIDSAHTSGIIHLRIHMLISFKITILCS